MAEELFRMENIVKTFPGVKALDGVSFSVNKGEVHGLVGENGAGKSTLMKIMSGVYRADSGKIFIENKEVKIDSVSKAQQLGIGIIFQELNLCPHLTVADNIFIGRPPKIAYTPLIDDARMHREAARILDDLGIDIDTHRTISSLSVAQQQMVEIAKAISHNARILVLDEPSAALTDKEIEQLFKIIRSLQKKQVGMVYISHRMEELNQICERFTVLRDGQYIGTKSVSEITMDELVKMIVGRSLDEKYPIYERKIGPVLLEAWDVRRGKKVQVDHIAVRRGEILGIAGLVGAGRTELARCLFGADRPDHMRLELDGKPVAIHNTRQAIAQGIGYATEDRKFDGLALGLTVEYNINMAHLRMLAPYGVVNDIEGRKNADHYIKALRIKTPTMIQLAKNLSGGNQQKIVLSKWLCNNVRVLIVDEPTRGIDVGAKFEIYELFNQLSDQGVAIIMISSELPEILGMSDRVIVLHEGEISAELVTKNTTQEEILSYAAGYNKKPKAQPSQMIAGAH